MRSFILFVFFMISGIPLFAQMSIPAMPESKLNNLQGSIPVVQLEIPVRQTTKPQKNTFEPQPLSAGFTIPFSAKNLSAGRWTKLTNGTFIWRLAINVKNTRALNLYFSNFKLQKNDKLFVYDKNHNNLLGAFTSLNNGKYFATGYLDADEIIIELDSPEKYDSLPFQLKEVGNIITKPKSVYGTGFGAAGSCEVPVNCPEGKNYQKQKRGVVRILLRSGSSLYWCTGSLVNDTKNDGKPYLLTANHCGQNANSADYSQWVFYFNYESPNCSRPATEPPLQSLSGSRLLASAVNSTSIGSDFKLLLLTDTVPIKYKPYFNGWNTSGAVSNNGVTIHHPEGDIKMISTYTSPVVPVNYYSSTPNSQGMYWKVNWAATQDGHGVTEPGSSGAPLFDASGLIIGTLTGGDAACANPNAPDYFGRYSAHWDKNGTDSTLQLKYWLDAQNMTITKFPGFDPLSQEAFAVFSSDVKNVPAGGIVKFVNLSTGPITAYHWTFEGGIPASSDQKIPPPVSYKKLGNYSVSLRISYPGGQKSDVQPAFIHVKPVIYPNPAKEGKIHILLGSYNPKEINIKVYNMLGQPVTFFSPEFSTDGVTVNLPNGQNGLFIIRLKNKTKVHTYKVINLHR